MPPRTGGEDGHERWTAALAQRVEEREERIRRAYGAAAEAVTVPAAERRAWIASRPDCLCPEFVELMIAMARERRGDEPRESVRFAHLAVTAAEASVEHGGEHGDDARALAWAELGNAHRICGDLRNAGVAFQVAQRWVRHAADPLVRAEVYFTEAAYRDYTREFDEAARLLRRAERLQTRFGECHTLGLIRILQAEVARRTEKYIEAIDYLESALSLLDTRREPRLTLVAVHNLAHCLINVGALDTALVILQRYRPAYRVFGGPRDRIRRTWLEARIALRSGDPALGEPLLIEVRDRFAEIQSIYEVALVDLDLAQMFATQERWPELELLASETFALCQACGVGDEALAAARLLLEGAKQRQMTAASAGVAVGR